jgi:aspartate/methionine/tyrosine aminotransferase
VGGIDELREAVVAEFRTNYGLACEPVEVVVSYGAKHGLYNLLMRPISPPFPALLSEMTAASASPTPFPCLRSTKVSIV